MQQYIVIDLAKKDVFNTEWLPDGIELNNSKVIIDLSNFSYSYEGQKFKEIEQDHL